jgi:hypothetical protein
VSRVLPPVSDLTSETDTFTAALSQAEIQSNYALIQTLAPYVEPYKNNGYTVFTDAVRNAVKQYLPELISVTDDIVQLMCAYYGVYDIKDEAGQ